MEKHRRVAGNVLKLLTSLHKYLMDRLFLFPSSLTLPPSRPLLSVKLIPHCSLAQNLYHPLLRPCLHFPDVELFIMGILCRRNNNGLFIPTLVWFSRSWNGFVLSTPSDFLLYPLHPKYSRRRASAQDGSLVDNFFRRGVLRDSTTTVDD